MSQTGSDAGEAGAVASWLARWLVRRRAATPGYSFRDFAREAGESNLTILHAVITGSRRATPDMILRWRGALQVEEPTLDWLYAASLVEEASHELDRRRRWSERRGTLDAARQVELAEALLAERRAALASRARGGEGARGLAAAVELAQVGLGEPDGDRGQLLLRLEEGIARMGEVRPSNAGPKPIFGLTQETGPRARARLAVEIARLRDDLLARSAQAGSTARVHVQAMVYPVTRSTLSEPPPPEATPSSMPGAREDTPRTSGEDPPDLFAWGRPEDAGAKGYLEAWWRWRGAQAPRLTLQAFAEAAEQEDRAWLCKVLTGSQRVTPLRARQLGPALELGEGEGRYLVALVERDLASGPRRERLQEELDHLLRSERTRRPDLGRLARY